jgi:2-polyprenyl-3-methyl-5-hydroxy-6-metoxy-1,4-benzoquinol methylase
MRPPSLGRPTPRKVNSSRVLTRLIADARAAGGLYALNTARVPFFARTWRSLLGEGASRMLDVGCGGGVATAPMAAEGFAMTGVDMSPHSIERARADALRQRLNIT